MNSRYPHEYGKRLTDKCRAILNKKTIELNSMCISNSIDLTIRSQLKLKHEILIGGAVYNMSIDNNAIFHKEYKKLEKEYSETNK